MVKLIEKGYKCFDDLTKEPKRKLVDVVFDEMFDVLPHISISLKSRKGKDPLISARINVTHSNRDYFKI